MSIFVASGMDGQIKTTKLPSGDMSVSCSTSGALEQIMFNICHWDRRRNPNYGGWIIPSQHASRAYTKLLNRCTKIAD